MHILLYKMLDIFLVLQTRSIFFFSWTVPKFLGNYLILPCLAFKRCCIRPEVWSTGLVFLHYKGNNPLSSLVDDFWFSRFYSLSAGSGTVPHPIRVSHTFPSKPSSWCSFFTHRPWQFSLWISKDDCTKLLFLEALSSPGLWQENSICLGIPRFTGWSTEFRESPWFLLSPCQLTVVWKSSKATTEPRIGLTSFVYQLLGITVLCFLLPCVLNATVLRVVCTLSNLYCFGRRKTFLIVYLGWKHKSSLVHI